MMRRLLLLLLVMFVGVGFLSAQNDDDAVWREMLEQWAEQNDSESVPDDLVEQLQDFRDSPINLNDTNIELVVFLPFLTDYHQRTIRAYIDQNGEMVSMNELYLLNGFDTITMRLLFCFAKVEHVENDDATLRQLLRKGHSNFVIGGKELTPQSKGYQNDVYEGSPMRLYFRYYFRSSDRINFQISGEKDAGELLYLGDLDGIKRYGFDYYSYHLMLNNFGRIKSVIAGKYQLHFGQGLTLWSGSAPWMLGSTPLRRYGMGIRPASAFCEYGYMRGVATTVSLLPLSINNTLELTVFYSNVDRDATASVADTSEDSEMVFQSLSQNGLHRTVSEMRRKGQLNEQLYGGRLQYRTSKLVVGATAYATNMSDEVVPVRNVYNYFAFSGKDNFNYGFDAVYVGRKIQLFGEIAASPGLFHSSEENGWLPLAGVAGMQMQMSDNNYFSMAYRYGSPTYRNLHSNMIGQGSSTSNEEGMLFYFRTRLPGYVNLMTSADFFRYPSLKYNIYSPSTGADYRIRIDKELKQKVLIACQYRNKISQRNSDSQLYSVETVRRQQLQMSLDYKPSGSWQFLSRVVYSWFRCDDHQSEQGFLMSQDVNWKGLLAERPFSLGMRLSLFDISDYDARIYLYESDLSYEYGVPMLNGRGIRGYLVCRYEFSQQLMLSMKYVIAYYPGLESLGSGNDRVEGNKKQEIKLQLRWRF